jgi:hypothetical protein
VNRRTVRFPTVTPETTPRTAELTAAALITETGTGLVAARPRTDLLLALPEPGVDPAVA